MLQVLLSAVAIALLGSLDSLLTSLVMDNIRGTRHRSNKELIGQGLEISPPGSSAGCPVPARPSDRW